MKYFCFYLKRFVFVGFLFKNAVQDLEFNIIHTTGVGPTHQTVVSGTNRTSDLIFICLTEKKSKNLFGILTHTSPHGILAL